MARASGVVALLTDYGLQDSYAGILKGVILSQNPAARIVDVTHDVPPQDIREGARVLTSAHAYFPEGTVFVCVIDPGVGTDRPIVGMETRRHFFLAPDNGLLDFLEPGTDLIRKVEIRDSRYFLHPVSSTFHGRDIFGPVAGRLSRGTPLGRFGPALRPRSSPRSASRLSSRNGRVQGEIVGIDRFGNLITNIPESVLPHRGDVRITVGRRVLRGLARTYADAPLGRLLALVGSTGHLEISVNQGSASQATRARKGDRILVTGKTT